MSLNPQCWYSETVPPLPQLVTLEGEAETDVCVIGAGVVGCTAAARLAASGLSVRVLEARRVGFGASGRSGGQIVPGVPLPFFGTEKSVAPLESPSSPFRAAWESGVEAVRTLRETIENYRINCDFVQTGHLRLVARPRQVDELAHLARLLETMGRKDLRWIGKADVSAYVGSEAFYGGLLDPMGGHLNPLKLVVGLAGVAMQKGAVFHENTPYLSHVVTKDGSVVVKTPFGRVKARWLIIAGGAFLWERDQVPYAAALPVDTFMAATEPLDRALIESLIPGDQSVADTHISPNKFRRTPDNRLLIGGILSAAGVDPFNMRYALADEAKRAFPQLPKKMRITHAWGGPISVTRNRLPHFGRLQEQVLFAQGFCGQGVAMATLAGETLAAAARETDSRFDVLSSIAHKSYPFARYSRVPWLLADMTAARAVDVGIDLKLWWDEKRAQWDAKRAAKAAEALAKGPDSPES